jgi:hypothetical protein
MLMRSVVLCTCVRFNHLKFLFNTRCDDAGTRVCIYDLQQHLSRLGFDTTLNVWNDYRSYDVVVFMGYDSSILNARYQNPNIKVVLADPKLTSKKYIKAAIDADLLLVSSIEQRDSFLRLNQNILIYYMFPDFPRRLKNHTNNKSLILAYHGNRVHLDAMQHFVSPALSALARERPVELHCIYNIAHLGLSDLSHVQSRGVQVKHIQWNPDTLLDDLSLADIGLMPNELPIRERLEALSQTAYPVGAYAYEPFDHLVRYKVSSNPGRLFPFACVGIPVVADFCPSASQFLRDGVSGFIASSPHGWYFALNQLALSSHLRQSCAYNLYTALHEQLHHQVLEFVRVCQNQSVSRPPYIDHLSFLLEQRKYNDFPRPQETFLRWLRRQIRRFLHV